MAFNFSPKIVTDSLVLYLDAANINSYVSGSTTWRDLSRGGNNGTLVNGPTFSSANGGCMVFDGINDYVSLLNKTTNNFTIDCWINTTSTSRTGTAAYEGNGLVWSDVAGVANDFVLSILNNKISFFTGDANTTINSTTIVNTGLWFYVTIIKNGVDSVKQLFINAVSESTGACTSSILNANPIIIIGGNTLDSKYFNGNIGQVRIYNKALSATEVLQNYNATKSRYI